MSGLDFIGAVIVLGVAASGWYSGWIIQAGRIVVLLFSVIIARGVVVPVSGFYQRITETEPQSAMIVTFIMLLIVVYLVLYVGLHRLTGEVRDQDWGSTTDKFFGARAGLLHGLGWMFVVGVTLVNLSYAKGWPSIDYDASRVGQVAMERDFLAGPALTVTVDTEIYQEDRPRTRHLRGYERRTIDE